MTDRKDAYVIDQFENITRYDIKRNNRLRIYNSLREEGKLSCLDLSTRLGLSLPTVGRNIAELEEQDLIRSADEKKNTGGRSSRIYEVIADYRVAIGVSITKHHISAVALDLQGTVIAHVRYRQRFVRDDAYFQKIGKAVKEITEAVPLQDGQILGVAIVVPALLTGDGKRTYYDGVLGLDTNTTSGEFAKYIPYPSRFYHDASSAAYAESWYRKDDSSFFYMMISDSICGAPILDGVPYRGLNNRSGEIGHMTMVHNGRLCYCGKKGCMDPYCSTKALSGMTRGDLARYFELLEQGDERAAAKWKEYLHYFTTAVIAVRMLFDSNIVIGGYLGQYAEKYLDEIRRLVQAEDPFCDHAEYLSVCVCKHEASASGGALALIDQFIRTV